MDVLGSEAQPFPNLGDTIEFTTTVGGSIKPSITLGGPKSNLSLKNSTFGAEVVRTDVHKLAVVFAVDEQKAAENLSNLEPGTSPTAGEKAASRTPAAEAETADIDSTVDRFDTPLQPLLVDPSAKEALVRQLDRQEETRFRQDAIIFNE